MKKHRYSAKNIKQAVRKHISTQTAGRRNVFGVDMAKGDFFGVLMQRKLTVIKALREAGVCQTSGSKRSLKCADSGVYRVIYPEDILIDQSSPQYPRDSIAQFPAVACDEAPTAGPIADMHWTVNLDRIAVGQRSTHSAFR